ncbi:MAG: amidohydrolase family protein, partial [Pseudomonadota bacterium]|nr:amidohydrolase family protein [Pseudomonadota bacterium]
MNKNIGFVDCAFRSPASEGASGGGAHSHGERREVVVNGTRVKTVDIHAHCVVPKALAILDEKAGNQELLMDDTSTRIAAMDAQGPDMAALSINPYWYHAGRDAAAEVVRIQNEALIEICEATPDRFTAFATAAFQHPDLAVEQIEYAARKLGFRGVSVGGSI